MKRAGMFLFAVLYTCSFFSLAKTQVPQFAHTWGGTNPDWGFSIAFDANGNIYVAGATRSSSSGNTDILLLKYAPDGSFLWYKSWDFGGNEGASDLKVDYESNIVITAGMNDNSDGLLLKTDSTGTLLWSKQWHRTWEANSNLEIDSSGNIYFCGQTIVDDIDNYIFKFDKNGNALWLKTWDKNINDATGSDVAFDCAGGVILTGGTGAWAACDPHDALIIKLDTAGDLHWDRAWDAGGNEGISNVATDQYANIYVTGFMSPPTGCPGSNGSDVFILKFDSAGNLLWQRSWGGSSDEGGQSISIDGDLNIYVTGSTNSFGGGRDLFLLKMDTAGGLIFQKVWAGAGDESGTSVLLDNACNIHVAGYALNYTGSWQIVSGNFSTPLGSVDSLGGAVEAPPYTVISIPGTTTPVNPVPDFGGGADDLLLLKLQNKGDINQDGSFSPADVVLELNCIFLSSGDCSRCFTDLNCDGNLTPSDVVLELNFVFLGINTPCQ
ncbi:MAG TPA: SBBP repeat-containing protein [Verrucomicrobiae bacterium]|nr:SBBP repeat-containing protein [Verrucomicrobiae bacterium]